MRQLKHHEILNTENTAHLSILVNNLHSPFNAGSLFRLADTLGIEKIFFSGESIYPPNRKIAKTSRATEQFVAFEYIENPEKVIEKLQEENYKIISLEFCTESIEIQELKLNENDKICLILGEENRGVADHLLHLSDEVCHINMYGKTSSMNVITAATIACYELLNKIR